MIVPAPVRHLLSRIVQLGWIAFFSGCVLVGPDYVAPTASELHVPRSWGAVSPATKEGIEVADWWQHLGAPLLTRLIAEAMKASPNLEAARAKLREARAQRRLAAANLGPTVSASGSAQYFDQGNGSVASGPSNSGFGAVSLGASQVFYDAVFDASWEPDIFGGQRRALEGARADEQAAIANLHSAQVSLAAELARNYVEMRSYQAEIEITRANLESQIETLNLTDWRVQAGLATSLDFEQARTNVEQTRASIPLLVTSIAEARHRVATLLGLAPDALSDEFANQAPIPEIPYPLTVGIPANILRQRPDVAAAERTLAAETAKIGVAKAAWYPSFTLSGSIGVESITLAALTSGSSMVASLAASVAQTLFDSGRISAQVEIQSAVQEQALATYRSTVLTALQDVENALVSLSNYRLQAASLARGVESARNAALLARQEYSAGIVDFQSVLDTQRTVLTVEESLNTAQTNSAIAAIQLYKALGGGWSTTQDHAAGKQDLL